MSISEVAKRAGVSRATVSRVINKRNGVSAEIASAVREAVAALGYQPPPLERRQGRRSPIIHRKAQQTVAVVLLDDLYQHTPGVFAAHLAGIEREANDHGAVVLVMRARNNEQFHASLRAAEIDGAILMGSCAEEAITSSLERFPSVWLSSHHGRAGDSVLAGNQQISRIAVDYLVRRGHRHLGFLAVMSSYPAYPARAESFRFFGSQAKVAVSIYLDDENVSLLGGPQSTDLLQRRIELVVDQMLAASTRPTGLFVPNDLMTAMAYVALRARGVVPGRDVDVISCNNETAYLVGLDPRPATIDIGAEIIGRRCVEQLLRRIRHPEEVREVQIAVTPVLIEAGSASYARLL